MKLSYTKAAILISGVAMMMSACGDTSQTANEANFKDALNAHFSKMKECSGVRTGVDDQRFIGAFQAEGRDWTAKDCERFESLEKVGGLEAVKFQKTEKSALNPGTANIVDYVGYKFTTIGPSRDLPRITAFHWRPAA